MKCKIVSKIAQKPNDPYVGICPSCHGTGRKRVFGIIRKQEIIRFVPCPDCRDGLSETVKPFNPVIPLELGIEMIEKKSK